VPGFINLLPPDLTKRAGSASPSENIAVPASAVPKFGKPDMLVPDNFWSNLKQFLTERPIKVTERPDAPFTRNAFGAGIADNLKDFFKSGPTPKGPVNNRLAVNWGSNFGGFGYRIKEFFSPTKQPPLPFEVKPVRVKEIWSKDENFGWTQTISFGVHGLVLFLLAIPLIWHFSTPIQAKNNVDVTPIDISPYMAKLPAGDQKAGGGGGANDHTLAPVNKGKVPKFKMTQFTPPQVHPLPDPKLPMDPSLLGPPDLKVNNPNLPTWGDPLANGVSDSLGHGNGTGIGSGNGGGLGPGEGAGTGGGAFRAGVNGVGVPTCLYCPNPPYSDEARKAKYQGTVVLQVTITTDGRAIDIKVVKGPGMGLEEKAMEAVQGWKFRPAMGPNGKAVNVTVPIEVTFHLY
jgi:protein TonB